VNELTGWFSTFPNAAMKSCLILAMLLLPGALCAANWPNIVIVLADDQGWGGLSINGKPCASVAAQLSLRLETIRPIRPCS